MNYSGKDLSVAILARDEGILIHKTLLSVMRALEQADMIEISEIVLHVDSPDRKTEEYLICNKDSVLAEVTVVKSEFSDAGKSVSTALRKLKGKIAVLIHAGDLITTEYLTAAKNLFRSDTEVLPYVLHPGYTIHFGEMEWIDKAQTCDVNERAAETIVYENCWSSVIAANREFLSALPFPDNVDDYSVIDWWISAESIATGAKHVVAEKSVVFEREQLPGAVRLGSGRRSTILPKNHGYDELYVKDIGQEDENWGTEEKEQVSKIRKAKDCVRKLFPNAYTKLYKWRRKINLANENEISQVLPAWAVINGENNIQPEQIRPSDLPNWLTGIWSDIHSIDSEVVSPKYFSRNFYLRDMSRENNLRIKVGNSFKRLLSCLKGKEYDYALVVPWLVVGGADKYIIEMINAIQASRPNLRILAIGTLHAKHSYAGDLDERIDFVDLGSICDSLAQKTKLRLFEHLIENTGVTVVHVMNSELGYEFLEKNATHLKKEDIKSVITSFNRQVDTGFYSGFTVAQAPKVIEQALIATSDNSETLRIWEQEYGVCKEKLLLIRQKCEVEKKSTRIYSTRDRLRVLWASRLDPQKIPEIVPEIAKLVEDFADVDMYGYYNTNTYKKLMKKLSRNVSYKGRFAHGISSLPMDAYDVYLYTSSSDGTPNAILESINEGLPVVAPAVGGIPDIIIDGKTGVLVPDYCDASGYAEGLNRLRDASLRRQYAEDALSLLERELSAQKHQELIDEYVNRLGL